MPDLQWLVASQYLQCQVLVKHCVTLLGLHPSPPQWELEDGHAHLAPCSLGQGQEREELLLTEHLCFLRVE